MPCLIAVLIVAFPRVAVVLLYFFSTFFSGVYSNVLLPLLGFIFLPVTLIAYTWLAKSGPFDDTTRLIILVIAVLLDLGASGGAHRSRR
jgi:hypothetical protein